MKLESFAGLPTFAYSNRKFHFHWFLEKCQSWWRTGKHSGVLRLFVFFVYLLPKMVAWYDIPLLADRRDRRMRRLFTGMHDSSHCLHRLLQENSVESAIHTLRNRKNYRVPFARTNRFKNSFYYMPYKTFNERSWISFCNLHSVLTVYRMYSIVCHCLYGMSLSFYPAARLQDK